MDLAIGRQLADDRGARGSVAEQVALGVLTTVSSPFGVLRNGDRALHRADHRMACVDAAVDDADPDPGPGRPAPGPAAWVFERPVRTLWLGADFVAVQ